MLRSVRTLIVDEIHAVADRQARLAPGVVDRAAGGAGRGGRLQKIGLSATVSPIEEVARFLSPRARSCRSGIGGAHGSCGRSSAR